MTENEKVLQKLEQYKHLIHTQETADAVGLWAEGCPCTLISGSRIFTGKEKILQDFLGLIRDAYTEIQLISDQVDICFANDSCAIVVFAYHTVCTRRETGLPYGIQGLETQVYVKEQEDWKLAHVQYSGKAIENET